MSGMSLQTGFRAYAAAPPSAAGTTITQQAYGPASGAGYGAGPRTAFFGTTGSGVIAAVLLTWLWWTLPR